MATLAGEYFHISPRATAVCLLPFQSLGAAVLKGKVVDAASGKIIPVRLSIHSLKGTAYFAESAAKAGSAIKYDKQRSPTSVEQHVTLSAHAFQVDRPPGEYRVSAYQCKEYIPATEAVHVKDQSVEVTVSLKRWTNMASRCWYSGDTHVYRLVQALPNVMRAEDLNVALPLTNWVTISDQPPSRSNLNTG